MNAPHPVRLAIASTLIATLFTSCQLVTRDPDIRVKNVSSTDDGSAQVVATTSNMRGIVFRNGTFTAEPSPDTAVEIARTFSAALEKSVSAGEGNSKSLNASVAATLNTALTKLGTRSQGVIFLRDATYRLAEARANSIAMRGAEAFADRAAEWALQSAGEEYREEVRQELRDEVRAEIQAELSAQGKAQGGGTEAIECALHTRSMLVSLRPPRTLDVQKVALELADAVGLVVEEQWREDFRFVVSLAHTQIVEEIRTNPSLSTGGGSSAAPISKMRFEGTSTVFDRSSPGQFHFRYYNPGITARPEGRIILRSVVRSIPKGTSAIPPEVTSAIDITAAAFSWSVDGLLKGTGSIDIPEDWIVFRIEGPDSRPHTVVVTGSSPKGE